MIKIIRLDVTEEQYKEGKQMINQAIQLAHIHGGWDNERALRVFGSNGWLPDWNELEEG